METAFYPNAMRNNHYVGFRPTDKPLQELIDAIYDVWDGFSLCQFPCFILVWHGRIKVNCWPFRLWSRAMVNENDETKRVSACEVKSENDVDEAYEIDVNDVPSTIPLVVADRGNSCHKPRVRGPYRR